MSFDGELDPHIGVVLALTFKRPDPFEPYTELEFRSVVQDTLRKAQFIHFDGLKSNFKSRKLIADQDVGYLVREESMKAMKSTKVPLSLEIISMLLDKWVYFNINRMKYDWLGIYFMLNCDIIVGFRLKKKKWLLYLFKFECVRRVLRSWFFRELYRELYFEVFIYDIFINYLRYKYSFWILNL